MTSLSIMRLIPNPPGRIVGGQILYKGKDLVKLDMSEMRSIRGNEISMIFQEPMTSLNPVFTVGNQICEAIALHQDFEARALRDKAIEMLKLVGIPSPEKRRRRLSAPAFGRHAPARDDRDGAFVQSAVS